VVREKGESEEEVEKERRVKEWKVKGVGWRQGGTYEGRVKRWKEGRGGRKGRGERREERWESRRKEEKTWWRGREVEETQGGQ